VRMYVCMQRFGGTSTRVYTHTQARGATPELRRVADTYIPRLVKDEDDDDDKFTPTKHLTPPPHHSSRPASAHTDTETHTETPLQ